MTLTNTGFAEVAGLLNGETTGVFEYIALGTDGATGADPTDTALNTETAATDLERQIGTTSRTTTTETNDTATISKTFTNTSSGTVAVTEAGLFDASSTGIMLSHQVFASVSVEDDNSLQVTFNVKVSA